ncbi:glucose-methanol-choline gmc oxidoreductase [Holotrichia oblita]|uniref:Glucose-methanol-choline gmc oxidoreductase n=1 Tax=Holotrichia oblita TaxID=644536 RepID=A0ACB9SRZ3_HOLOL|nr:glucose-methanol-choline gmc oxidoreductase [Holotrichia oblita]
MLSGIGPAHDLENFGIPILQDLPVGKYMQDHLTFVGLVFTVNQSDTLNVQTSLTTESVRNYLNTGTGPITSLGGVEGLAYVQVLDSKVPNFPDVELLFVGGALNGDYGLGVRRSMHIKDDVYDVVWRPLHDVPTWTIFPMPLHPESIGSIKLRSKNPYDPPLLYGNYFTDPQGKDMATIIASIRFILKLAETKAFKKVNTKFSEIPVPGCERFQFNSDPYWECAVRALTTTLHHQVGTCKMGPSTDANAIVDAELKVHGIRKLRVADCSVIPFAITAHTSAPCVMIGEKGADLIKRSWGAVR